MSIDYDVKKWLESGENLPEFMRDFHDQKELFKTMHSLYSDNEGAKDKPNWMQGQIYVIDWFLWFMASRGYTLQKSRKELKFNVLDDDIKAFHDYQDKCSPLRKIA